MLDTTKPSFELLSLYSYSNAHMQLSGGIYFPPFSPSTNTGVSLTRVLLSRHKIKSGNHCTTPHKMSGKGFLHEGEDGNNLYYK